MVTTDRTTIDLSGGHLWLGNIVGAQVDGILTVAVNRAKVIHSRRVARDMDTVADAGRAKAGDHPRIVDRVGAALKLDSASGAGHAYACIDIDNQVGNGGQNTIRIIDRAL